MGQIKKTPFSTSFSPTGGGCGICDSKKKPRGKRGFFTLGFRDGELPLPYFDGGHVAGAKACL